MTDEQAKEARAEQADDKAYRASIEASSFASLEAKAKNTVASNRKMADVYMAAAGAHSEAAQAHQDHADAGGIDAAGRAAEFADSPAEAAERCRDEAERYASWARFHEQTASKLSDEAEAEARAYARAWMEMPDLNDTEADLVAHFMGI